MGEFNITQKPLLNIHGTNIVKSVAHLLQTGPGVPRPAAGIELGTHRLAAQHTPLEGFSPAAQWKSRIIEVNHDLNG